MFSEIIMQRVLPNIKRLLVCGICLSLQPNRPMGGISMKAIKISSTLKGYNVKLTSDENKIYPCRECLLQNACNDRCSKFLKWEHSVLQRLFKD